MALFDKIKEYFDRKPDLHVLFIFDAFGEKVDELMVYPWPDDYHFEEYNGGAFRVKYNLEHEWKNQKTVILVRGVSPADEQSRLAFPLLDVLASNMEFMEDSAELYMQEHGIKHDLIDYVRRNVTKLQRRKNDELLVGLYKDLTTDILNRSIISAELDSSRLLDWKGIFLKIIQLGRECNAKRRYKVLNAIYECKDAFNAMEKAAYKTFGFRRGDGEGFKEDAMIQFFVKSLKYNSLCGVLPLAKGDVYAPFKVTSSLDALNDIWNTGMQQDGNLADAIDELASDIREEYILQTYGAEADYFRLTRNLAFPIMKSLLEERLWIAPAEVNEKIRTMLGKTSDEDVKRTLNFLSSLCDFYAAKANTRPSKQNSSMDFIKAYTDEFYLLDMYYRQALEHFVDLSDDNPVKEDIERAKAKLDSDYGRFCNQLNLDWVKTFDSEGGDFDALDVLRQENFYDKVQKPGVKLVVIVSDAFRYELGVELAQELLKSKHHPRLDFALAQLPTETKYCKTALLPHKTLEFADGEDPALMVDGSVPVSLKQREEQAKKYVPDALCLNYKDLDGMPLAEKREIFKHSLVYVFHDAVDDSGHDHNATYLTRTCRSSIEDLAKLIHSLHSSMNVSNVVVSADHGFLFNDTEFTEKDKYTISEGCTEKKTRYYLTASSDTVYGISKFQMSKVSGMKNSSLFAAVPTGTNRMAAPGGYNFAHGGASLQELIIPVVYSSFKHDDEKQKVDFRVLFKDNRPKITSSILKITLVQLQSVSKEYKSRILSCAIYDNGKRVSNEGIIDLNSVSPEAIKRTYELTLGITGSAGHLLDLVIYDMEDKLNPVQSIKITNDTLIEQDF